MKMTYNSKGAKLLQAAMARSRARTGAKPIVAMLATPSTAPVEVLMQVTVNRNRIRVIQKGDHFYAQAKSRFQKRFVQHGNECETQDHAFFWALDAINHYFQDGKTFAMTDAELDAQRLAKKRAKA